MPIILLLIGLIFFSGVNAVDASVDMGVSIGEEGIKGFYFAIGDYYRVPQKEVIVVKEKRIPDEEIPVVFFLASRAHVAPSAIIDMRLTKKSWMDIMLHFGLSPEIFYVPVEVKKIGPPYGKAYGYYKNKPQKEWKNLKFSDSDIVDFVNLRFISEYHKYSPEKVINMRGSGKTFISINDDIVKEKKGKEKEKHIGIGKGKGKKE